MKIFYFKINHLHQNNFLNYIKPRPLFNYLIMAISYRDALTKSTMYKPKLSKFNPVNGVRILRKGEDLNLNNNNSPLIFGVVVTSKRIHPLFLNDSAKQSIIRQQSFLWGNKNFNELTNSNIKSQAEHIRAAREKQGIIDRRQHPCNQFAGDLQKPAYTAANTSATPYMSAYTAWRIARNEPLPESSETSRSSEESQT